jgi:hypothetical protein
MAQARPTIQKANNATAPPAEREREHMMIGQRLALLVGIVFLLVGVAGFIPGLTSDFHDMAAAGHESHAKLLGLFQISVLHNVVHILFGIAGVVAARALRWSKTYLIVGGAIYLGLALFGFAIDHSTDVNFVPVNRADDWLHVALGVGMIALGLLAANEERSLELR